MEEQEQPHPTDPLDRRDLILLSSLLVLLAILIWNASGKLMHPLIDIGRDLYIPERIAAGQDVYTDISYYYPPLAPYLLAIPARLTSWDLPVVATIGILVASSTAFVLFLLSRLFVGRLAAGVATAVFVSLNATAAYTYGSNFIFPYSHGATFGILFFLTGLFFLLRELRTTQSAVNWWMALSFMIAAGWCKLELAAFGMLTMIVSAILYRAAKIQTSREIVGRLFLGCGAAVLLLTLGWAYFREAEPHWLFGQILAPTLLHSEASQIFYSRVTGSFMWELNLRAALLGAFLVILYGFALRALDTVSVRKTTSSRLAIALVALAIIAFCIHLLSGDRFLFFRAWTILQPLVLIAVLARLVHAWRNGREIGNGLIQTLLIVTASMALSSRIYLHISPRWYGFWMTIPLYLLIVDVLLRMLPRWGVYTRRATLLWLPLFAVICINGISDQVRQLGASIYPISSARGDILDYDPYRASIMTSLLSYLEEAPVDQLVVMPEGLTINYLSRIPNPIWYHTFSPMELGEADIESDVINSLESSRVPWILISNLSYPAWGGEGFGRGYAINLDTYLRERYALEKEWRSPTFRFFLLKRKPD